MIKKIYHKWQKKKLINFCEWCHYNGVSFYYYPDEGYEDLVKKFINVQKERP